MTDLKPCPRCHSSYLDMPQDDPDTCIVPFYRVKCEKRGHEGEPGGTPTQAAERWNAAPRKEGGVMTDGLAACPCCKSRNIDERYDDSCGVRIRFMQCEECGYRGGDGITSAQAERQWNEIPRGEGKSK